MQEAKFYLLLVCSLNFSCLFTVHPYSSAKTFREAMCGAGPSLSQLPPPYEQHRLALLIANEHQSEPYVLLSTISAGIVST